MALKYTYSITLNLMAKRNNLNAFTEVCTYANHVYMCMLYVYFYIIPYSTFTKLDSYDTLNKISHTLTGNTRIGTINSNVCQNLQRELYRIKCTMT